ncbi:MFS transporter [Kitasatospora sp. NPDC096147]|uniref:MFS transporter n=1 Tax=Kitasatospora sp. NPDC096147 TaxID=3364093 RepID=UPI003820BC60
MNPWAAAAALALLAANLRAAVTVLPPLLPDLGVTGAAASVLTTLPVLCLALLAPCAVPLADRFGTGSALTGAMALLTAGQLLRAAPGAPALYAGTALAGAGIAIGNVLLPAVVKQRFPARTGPATGLAMTAMTATAALAAALSVPLAHAAGPGPALALWAAPALAAALFPSARTRSPDEGTGHHPGGATAPGRTGGSPATGRAADLPAGRSGSRHRAPVRPKGSATEQTADAAPSLLREPLALAVAGFLGLVSLVFYVLTAWLPQLMRDQGHDPARAGLMVSVFLLVGIPLGLGTPVLAARLPDQRPLAAAVGAATGLGLAGLLLVPQAAWLWVVLLGVANGLGFPLAVTLLGLRTPDPATAARLSALAQSAGYGLAALGPLTVGLLHGATGGWTVPLLLLLALVLPETALGLTAAAPGLLGAGPAGPRPARRGATRARRQSAPNGSG